MGGIRQVRQVRQVGSLRSIYVRLSGGSVSNLPNLSNRSLIPKILPKLLDKLESK